MTDRDQQLVDRIVEVINKAIYLEKKKVFEIQRVKLYPSEIHLMMAMDEEQYTNATKMASRLGQTKSAVSQTLNRLEKKGILQKTRDPYKKNELTMHLTPLGKQAFEQCRDFRNSMMGEYHRYLSNLEDSEKDTIREFVIQLGSILDKVG